MAAILVVEDNPITRKLVRVALQSAGHRVLEASDARTAFDLAQRDSPELVIQDLVLPDLHGFELFVRLRTLLPGVPILGFTGLISKQDEARALSLGFDDFLTKPLEPSRLLEAVEAYLPASTSKEGAPGVGKRLLIVDDDAIQLKLTGLRLRDAGFEVQTVGDGHEALALARAAPPDAVISDVLMPGVDGLRLCHALRREPALANVPVVLVSSKYVEDADRELGRRVGASAFVLRTPGLEEVKEAVVSSLRTPLPPVGRWDESIEAEYVERVVRQLERQVGINASLLERATLKASSLTVIGAVSEALAGLRDVETALVEALDNCLDAAGLSKGALFLLENGELALRAKVGLPAGVTSEVWGSERLLEAAKRGSPQAIARGEGEDTRAHRLLIALEAGSALLLPLSARGELHGLLLLASSRKDLSLDDWLPFAQAVAAQFAQAIALTRAFAALAAAEEKTRARAAQQAAVAQLGQHALEGRASGELMAEVAGLLARGLGADLALVLEAVPASHGMRVRSAEGFAGEVVGGVLTVDAGSRFDVVLRSGGPVTTLDVRREGPPAAPLLVENGVTSALCIAIPGGREGPLGLLGVFSREKREFGPDDAHFLTAVAHVIAAAVERERVEGALRRSQALLAGIIETATDAVITLDHDRRIYLYNPAAERMFGRPASAVVGRAFDQLLAERFQGTRPDDLPAEFHGRRADGEEFPIEASVSQVEVDGRSFLTAIVRDISARERLKASLVQSQKMEAVGHLAGGVAHDFNNVLGVITGYGDLLQKDLGTGHAGQPRLEQIRKATERAASLTRQLLAFSRKQVLQPKVLDLTALVAEVDSMLRRVIGEQVELVSHLSPTLWRVLADPRQLELAILNLALNARDAMPQGGRIVLETANVILDEGLLRDQPEGGPGPYAMLAVRDSGEGIDPAIRPHIFEPFFTTKEPGKGTGLGLSTVYGIVRQSGGFIHVESESMKGSTFRLYLPRAQDQIVEASLPPAPGPAPRGSETVLLVEDDNPLREMIRELLEDAGYEVLEAAEPEQALSLSASHTGHIDLLLTDVVQPKMSGREVAQHIRAARPDVRVLYMSGYTPETIGQHGAMEANAPFLEKPFSGTGLLSKVRETLLGAPPS